MLPSGSDAFKVLPSAHRATGLGITGAIIALMTMLSGVIGSAADVSSVFLKCKPRLTCCLSYSHRLRFPCTYVRRCGFYVPFLQLPSLSNQEGQATRKDYMDLYDMQITTKAVEVRRRTMNNSGH